MEWKWHTTPRSYLMWKLTILPPRWTNRQVFVWGVQHFGTYIISRHFKVMTYFFNNALLMCNISHTEDTEMEETVCGTLSKPKRSWLHLTLTETNILVNILANHILILINVTHMSISYLAATIMYRRCNTLLCILFCSYILSLVIEKIIVKQLLVWVPMVKLFSLDMLWFLS